MFVNKRWVNLDGAIIPPGYLNAPMLEPNSIAFIGDERAIIACSNYITKQESWLSKGLDITVTDNLYKASYVIALNELGYAYANVLTRIKNFVWVLINSSSIYLDSRYTHSYAKRINEYSKVVGGAGGKMLTDTLDIFFEEFITLAIHNNSSKNPAEPFKSNVTIFDRIFHELNRSK